MIREDTLDKFPLEAQGRIKACFAAHGWDLYELAVYMQVPAKERLASLNPTTPNFVQEYITAQTEFRLWQTLAYNMQEYMKKEQNNV